MAETDTTDNTAIRSAREHIANLEAQLTDLKLNSSMTAKEKAELETQKAALEAKIAEAEQKISVLEQVQARNMELENALTQLVAEELKKFPEDKIESVKVMVEGLSPDKQLVKLQALKNLVGSQLNPPPGNPPPPPSATPPTNTPPQDDLFSQMKQVAQKGGDPLSLVTLKTS
jgi:DNA repair exonuclease SbcCD ATPase subunit